MKQKIYFYSTLVLLLFSQQLGATKINKTGEFQGYECRVCTDFYKKPVQLAYASFRSHKNTLKHHMAESGIGCKKTEAPKRYICLVCTKYYECKKSYRLLKQHKQTGRHTWASIVVAIRNNQKINKAKIKRS